MTKQDLGWDDAWATAFASLPGHDTMEPCRVTAVHRGRVELDGARLAPVAGAVAEPPVVGDWVAVRDGAVRAVLPRRTVLAREDGALVANADLAILMTSLNRDFNLRRIERFAALARAGGIEPLVVLTKGDLHPDPLAAAEAAEDELATEVLVVSAHQGWGVEALRAHLAPRRTAVLIGMSGVGKSTLVNLLLDAPAQRTLEVLRSDDRGRHATTHRELFVLETGAMIIDTPGVRRPGLATAAGVDQAFADIAELAQGCRFADCRHEDEPGCAVRGRVSEERLASLHKLRREGMTAEQRRARDRQIGKLARDAMRLKGRTDDR